MSHKSLHKEIKTVSTTNWHLPSTSMSFPGGSVIKNLPARQELPETQVQSPGRDHWRKKRQPAPVFLPGKVHEQRSLVGCSLWGHKELDTTEHACLPSWAEDGD